MPRKWTPTAADWARYGARPLTPEEVRKEKALIEKLRAAYREEK